MPSLTSRMSSIRSRTLDGTVVSTWWPSVCRNSCLASCVRVTRYPGSTVLPWFVFLVGSAVCGAAPNSPALIAGRAIAGFGSSGLLLTAFSLVPSLAPPPKTLHVARPDLDCPFHWIHLRSLDRRRTYPTHLVALELLHQLAPRCSYLRRLPFLCHPAEAWKWGFYLFRRPVADARPDRSCGPGAVCCLYSLGAAVGRSPISVGRRSHHRIAGSIWRYWAGLYCPWILAGRESNAPIPHFHPAQRFIYVFLCLLHNWSHLCAHLLPSYVRHTSATLDSQSYADNWLADGSKELKGLAHSCQQCTPFRGSLQASSRFLEAEQ